MPMVSTTSNIALLLLAVAALLSHLDGGNAFQPPASPTAGQRKRHLHCLNALSSRRECISILTSTIVAAPASIIAVASPQSALAAPNNAAADSIAVLNYNGVYTDPKNPKGYHILVGNTNTATLKLQDDPTSEVYKLPVQVEISAKNEQGMAKAKQFVFDFSPKGGPANMIGTFTKDREGIPLITFPDGNSWKKRETGPIGVYRDGLDANKIYVIRQFKGPELTVDVITNNGDGTESTTTTIRAKAGNPTILFELPGMEGGGGVPGVASLKKKTISFDDGNVWTKF